MPDLTLPDPPAQKSRARRFAEQAVEAVSGSVPFVGGALAVVLAPGRGLFKRLFGAF